MRSAARICCTQRFEEKESVWLSPAHLEQPPAGSCMTFMWRKHTEKSGFNNFSAFVVTARLKRLAREAEKFGKSISRA